MVVLLVVDIVARGKRSGMVRVRSRSFYSQLPKDYHLNHKLTEFGFGVVKPEHGGSSSCIPDDYEESDYERGVRDA